MGREISVYEGERISGIPAGVLYQRVHAGMTMFGAIKMGKKRGYRMKRPVNGEMLTTNEACAKYGVPKGTIAYRMSYGDMTLEEAINKSL